LDLFCFGNIFLANLLVVLIQDSFLPTTLEALFVLEIACIVAKNGAKGPILKEICFPKNTPLFRAPLTAH
jgi:hypothetical protein